MRERAGHEDVGKYNSITVATVCCFYDPTAVYCVLYLFRLFVYFMLGVSNAILAFSKYICMYRAM